MKKWFSEKWEKIENRYIFSAIGFIGVAILLPFGIYIFRNKNNYSTLDSLGPVGDFLGGSTIAFFNIASFLMLVAAIVMQKEELSLQRKELKATRNEYEITNATMKKQQFESTFFNMINLQQNILKEIQIDGIYGRDAIKELYNSLEKYYNDQFYKKKLALVLNELSKVDDVKLKVFCKELYLSEAQKDFFVKDNKRNNRLRVNIGQKVEEAKQTFSKQQSEDLKEEIKRAEDNFNKFSEDRPYQENYIRKNVNIVEFVALPNCLDIFKNFYKDYKDNPIFDYKKETYETVFDKNESVIGHYYRNLYRIMKIIQETVFDDSSIENNEKEKKKYRGILRAQLSSFELLMLFYNVVYSDKGGNFKKLLEGTSFFENHIVDKDFIWISDRVELENLK